MLLYFNDSTFSVSVTTLYHHFYFLRFLTFQSFRIQKVYYLEHIEEYRKCRVRLKISKSQNISKTIALSHKTFEGKEQLSYFLFARCLQK